MQWTAIQSALPMTGYRRFHSDPNINYQLNRIATPELTALFENIGARIKDFDDWKSAFLSSAATHETRGEEASASALYRAADSS